MIRSKPSTEEYRRNFDLIFGPAKKPKDGVRIGYGPWRDGWTGKILDPQPDESYDSHPQAD